MNLGYLFVTVAFIAAAGWSAADEDVDAAWTTFGKKDEERERFSNCFIVSYPSSLSIDPASGITPGFSFGILPIPEENLHTLVLQNGNKSLEVRACSYSFLDGEAYTRRGFTSPREVILTDFFQNAMVTKISRMENFDVFCSETDSNVVALFLDRDAKWGSCYQSLTFSFRNDTTLKDHAKVVEGIIARFIPGFARSK